MIETRIKVTETAGGMKIYQAQVKCYQSDRHIINSSKYSVWLSRPWCRFFWIGLHHCPGLESAQVRIDKFLSNYKQYLDNQTKQITFIKYP